eukprot:GILK01006589.1.p1 GENE.GILK01006589.1~~GILK01006589.1.p1  ORF type:complete len:121 (+),score=23.07 GILK01006589.1:33-365(+)
MTEHMTPLNPINIDLKPIFQRYDRHNRGVIDKSDLLAIATELNEGILDDALEKAVKIVEVQTTNGRLTFSQFCRWVISMANHILTEMEQVDQEEKRKLLRPQAPVTVTDL